MSGYETVGRGTSKKEFGSRRPWLIHIFSCSGFIRTVPYPPHCTSTIINFGLCPVWENLVESSSSLTHSCHNSSMGKEG